MRLVLASNIERIKRRFNVTNIEGDMQYNPSFNICPGQDTYVINDSQKRTIEIYSWGLNNIGKSTEAITTIRSEGDRNKHDDPYYCGSNAVFLKADYRKILMHNRCLVLADAFILGEDTPNPYLFHLRNKNRPFALAALYQENSHGEKNFAILTVVANPLIRQLGFIRMPVIFSFECESRWLRNTTALTDVLNCLTPFPRQQMNAYPISTEIYNLNVNDKLVIQPISKSVFEENNTPYKFVKKVKMKSSGTTTWKEQVEKSKTR